MDHRRFDDLATQLAHGLSRRKGLGLFAALGVGAGLLTEDADARKGKKHKKKKGKGKGKTPPVVLNTFGCVNVGNFCQTADQCCSGICTGPKGKTTCQAHDQTTCTGQNSACSGGVGDADCTTTTGDDGFCAVTTGNASYCVAALGSVCMTCARDTDCVAQCGSGAACLACPSCADQGFQTACASTISQRCNLN